MKINLSKKNKIIVIILLVLVLGGTGGYLLWRINQDDTVAPTYTDASGCRVVCVGTCEQRDASVCKDESYAGCATGRDADDGKEWCCTYTVLDCPETHSCGDKTCNSDETLASCPADCAKCGDNVCTSPTETLANCPGDCAVCGDKICTADKETVASCPEDCGKCGDGICSSTESSTSCASDCACKAMVWGNKPSGSYKPNSVATISPITITNPNSTSTTTTGIVIKLNDTTLTQCGSLIGASCFTLTNDSTKQQIVTLTLFGGQPTIAEGTYTISVTLPGVSDSCTETVSFTVAEDEIVVISGEVPDTGVFDGVMGKIYLGSSFVFLGIMTTQLSKFTYMFNTIGERNRVVLEEKKRKREEDKRNRFERRFK